MATKSKLQSLSARRSSPRTRSKSAPEPIPSPRTCSKSVPEPKSTPGTSRIPRTPFSFASITPIAGTLKSVSLSDWWLTKKANDEKVLGIAGFESKGGSEVRLFSPGEISIRHDSTTLETFDGITVCISGFINRSRTVENGISPEVCNHFLLGFPYNWKDYNEEGSVEKKKKLKHFTVSFDDIPVNRLYDLLLSSSPCLKGEILDDVVDSLRDLVCPSTKKPDKKCEKSRMDNDDESLVPRVVGVKTRGMLKRREEDETSIGKRVHTTSKKKRSREKNKGEKFLLN